MDTHRILLAGRNTALIDHIFIQMDDEFECMTTSMRPEDILNHINVTRYDAFIYCIQKDDRKDYQMMMGYKDNFIRKGTAFMIAGYKDECEAFQSVTGRMAAYSYSIPLSISDVKKDIMAAYEKHRAAVAAFEAQMSKVGIAPEPVTVSESPSEQSVTDAPGTEHIPTSDPGRKKILVIDDDPMVLKLIKGHLGDEYDMASAISGKVAYKFLSNKSVDLILLDYEMPEENGPMVYENIRKMEGEIRNVPIVFLTGITDREKLVKALSLRPNGYLPKPVNGPKLASMVRKLIG